IAAASQGPAALISDGVNGLLVPVDDAPALAAAIGRLIADPALKARLIERGRADYQRGFTREAVTRRMIALYTEIIAEHRGAGARPHACQLPAPRRGDDAGPHAHGAHSLRRRAG